jgi:hypothetical protein
MIWEMNGGVREWVVEAVRIEIGNREVVDGGDGR